MAKWVKFEKKHNFTPRDRRAAGLQWQAGDVDQVTDEAFESAKKAGAAKEIKAPANADDAKRMKAGELEVEFVAEAPAPASEDRKPAGGDAGSAKGKP